MTLKQVLKELKSLGTERMREQNTRNGAGGKQFGVKRGDIRKVAKKIKSNHPLALELWETENVDARFLAILLLKPKSLTSDEVDAMIRSTTFVEVTDWFTNYIVKKHADRESLRQEWMTTDTPMAARAGWALTSDRITKDPEGLDLKALLNRIESEMPDAAPEIQWTMNFALSYIGIHSPKHRKRAIAIGEKIGLYRDYPTSKGCTSPFAPICIEEMVRRQSD
jgi:3-methyladenine DNA glycosylase AlkD